MFISPASFMESARIVLEMNMALIIMRRILLILTVSLMILLNLSMTRKMTTKMAQLVMILACTHLPECPTVEGNYPAPVPHPEPPEDAIAMLVSMGFDRNSARQALIHSRNDVNIATNVLLKSQSH